MTTRSWFCNVSPGKDGRESNLHFLRWSKFAGVLALLIVKSAFAESLGEVRQALGELRGLSPIAAHIETEGTEINGKKKKEFRGSSLIEHDGTTLRVVYSKTEPAEPAPKKRKSAGNKGEGDDSPRGWSFIHYAPQLLDELEGAVVKRREATAVNGIDAMLLEVALKKKPQEEDKYLKSMENIITLWIGPDWLPIKTEKIFNGKGRMFGMVAFQFNTKETFQFTRVGDRLVVTRGTAGGSASAFGQTSRFTSSTTVTIRE